uniref:GATA-type domain-containing protein n=1 Tax=Mycena chlorophos TaxID=658473 RepID=A0ABQ0LAT7_MYCCL|nr:predicted protein [Mycena chlorophos]
MVEDRIQATSQLAMPGESRMDNRDLQLSSYMRPLRNASCGSKLPVCDHVDPPEWRYGKVSQTMVCNACAKYEARNDKLRSKAKEAERVRRMEAGARR